MNEISQYIGQVSNWWIPVSVFAFFVLVAGLIGAWTGWKTALYFLGWNIVALIPSVILLDKIIDLITENLPLDSLKNMMDITYVTHHFGGLLVLFSILLATNFLAFIFYWIFRKKLKRSIKENKEIGVSNASARWIGVGTGVITALPMATFLTETVSLSSADNAFTKFNGSLTAAFTGNEIDGYDNSEKNDIRGILNVVNDIQQVAEDVAKIFTGEKSDIQNIANSPESKAKVQDLLDNTIVLNSLDATSIKDKLPSGFDPTSVSESDINSINLTEDQKFTIKPENKQLVEKLMKEMGFTDSIVNSFFDHIFKH